MRRETREWLVLVGVAALVFVVLGSFSYLGPGATGTLHANYLLGVILTMCIFGLLAIGLSVEMGYAGLLNFGHVAFMAVGGYSVAIVSTWFTTRDGGAHDIRPALTGTTAWGLVACAFMALVAMLVVYVPVLLLLQRFAGRKRWPAIVALAVAFVAGAAAFIGAFPLGPTGALNMVVLLGLVLGVVLAAIAGALLGLTGLRLREDYLAIVTLGAAESLRLVLSNELWLTEGTQGIQSVPNPLVTWATRTEWIQTMLDKLPSGWNVLPSYFVLACAGVLSLILAFVLLETLARSPWGRVLKAIREDEEVASSLGKNVLLYKLEALMLGSAIAALAGALLVWNKSTAFPDDFPAFTTFLTFAILILGGVGNHKGAILGAIILWGILNLALLLTFIHGVAGPLQNIFVGIILILVVAFRPQGAIGSKEEMTLGK